MRPRVVNQYEVWLLFFSLLPVRLLPFLLLPHTTSDFLYPKIPTVRSTLDLDHGYPRDYINIEDEGNWDEQGSSEEDTDSEEEDEEEEETDDEAEFTGTWQACAHMALDELIAEICQEDDIDDHDMASDENPFDSDDERPHEHDDDEEVAEGEEDGALDEEEDGEDGDEDEDEEEDDIAPHFDAAAQGLKEISNLGKIIVSSFKPGNGVEELRTDDMGKFWQSDGPQPHRLTMHFIRRVSIRRIRFYVDYNEDESYTPTRIRILAGTGWHDLLQLCEMTLASPVGWQEVPIAGSGAGADGDSLACWIFQLVIVENHQNGKDTHIRGLKVYGLVEEAAPGVGGRTAAQGGPGRLAAAQENQSGTVDDYDGELGGTELRNGGQHVDAGQEGALDWFTELENRANAKHRAGDGGLSVADFMLEPELR